MLRVRCVELPHIRSLSKINRNIKSMLLIIYIVIMCQIFMLTFKNTIFQGKIKFEVNLGEKCVNIVTVNNTI